MTTCVLVADASRARIFEAPLPKDGLTVIEELVHPASKQHTQDMASDEPGVTQDRVGQGIHSMGQEIDIKKQEAIRFAKEVADRLCELQLKKDYAKLYVIAAPAFLGLLRNKYSSTTRKIIVDEISKNLATFTIDEIRAHLPKFL